MSLENNDNVHVFPEIGKSPGDKRNYRGIKLKNQMTVLLINDSDSDKAAAALTVAAGSMHDPENLEGLAHFCEHMLFMGTEKYPEENEYSKYLSDNGGSYNAYTAKDHTCFHFELSPNKLRDALDRFAQFFITPLFSESAVEREVKAVNSEHENYVSSDTWRIYEVAISTGNPQHPFSKFSTGNFETLWTIPHEKGINIREELILFHKKHYSANLMALVVLGKESLDELQEMIVSLFSKVENKNLVLDQWNESPYGENELKKLLKIVPVKDLRELHIIFPIPDPCKYFDSSPIEYITHLIGHEGKGSLLSYLKNKNWVNSLEASSQTPGRGFSFVEIGLELTESGLKNANECVKTVFQFLSLIKNEGVHKWIWKEIHEMDKMHFIFQDKADPEDFVCEIASILFCYPIENCLTGPYLTNQYKPEIIKIFLDKLTPDNCRVQLVSREFEYKTDLVEKWYGVKYKMENIDDNLIKEWKEAIPSTELKLPERNEFIPSNFDLKKRDENTGIIPSLLKNTNFSTIWYLQDNEFFLPKAVVRVEIRSPLPSQDPQHTVLNSLFVQIINDNLVEYSYNASLAGLDYDLSSSIYGVEVSVEGYNDKLDLLLKKPLEKLINFQCSQKRFDEIKESSLRALKNFENEDPSDHASYYLTYLLREKRWERKELESSYSRANLQMVKNYAKSFIENLNFTWLFYGNLTRSESLEFASKCELMFIEKRTGSVHPTQEVKFRELKLPRGFNYLYKTEHLTHNNSCTLTLFQTGMVGNRERAILDIIEHLTQEPCFDQLRTKEQLGYVVYANVRRANGTQGISIVVQGEKHPTFVEARIDAFLDQLKELLDHMNEEEFSKNKSAVITIQAEKPLKMSERSNFIWGQITSQHYNFDLQQAVLNELDELQLKDVKVFFDEYISPVSNRRKRLSIHVVSKTATDDQDLPFFPSIYQEKIENVSEWKKQHGLYPIKNFSEMTY